MSIYDISGGVLSSCYGVDGQALGFAYDVEGNEIFRSGRSQTDYSRPTVSNYKTITVANPQGMEIYNGVLFQFRGKASEAAVNNLVSLFDFSTGDTIYANMPIVSGHANAVAFSKSFYDPNDEFPIIYCGDWFDPIVHVNRITRTAATHLYDIVYDVANAGYHSNPCIDFDNEIMYTVGYYTDSTIESEGNHCIVCKWDLSDMTDNGDGTFTPRLLSRYTRDFIYVMQDLKFNDGYCWIESGYYTSSPQRIYAMNPETGAFEYTVTIQTSNEIEGLVWFENELTGLYYAYIGFGGNRYSSATFPKVS